MINPEMHKALHQESFTTARTKLHIQKNKVIAKGKDKTAQKIADVAWKKAQTIFNKMEKITNE
jgi:hypothetical protein|tara:strand:- start:329 stop:517 length:189 start_codon:yes stop_codon:yes gene_type:complete